MGLTPLPDVGLDLGVAAGVFNDTAPSTDRAAEATRQFTEFAFLAFALTDLQHVLVQHPRGNLPIGMQALVAAGIVFTERREFPLLARKPGQHTTFDSGEVRPVQLMSVGGA